MAITTDAQNEAAETFFLNLSNPQGVTITDAQAKATILNDDMGPVGIYDIQGAGHVSPFNGQAITTGGIVTQINANSFWIQDTNGDGLFATSDAIQVFIGAAPTGVTVGDLVTVAATVTEFLPTAGALSVTELTAPTITVTGRGTLPTAVLIGIDGILPPTNVIDDDRLPKLRSAQRRDRFLRGAGRDAGDRPGAAGDGAVADQLVRAALDLCHRLGRSGRDQCRRARRHRPDRQ